MGAPRPRPVVPAARLEIPVEEWPYLDEGVLVKTRSRKVCMTCHWFRHHSGVNCIPVLTCQLHQGLIAHGEHLTSRCQGWTDDVVRQKGWLSDGRQVLHFQPRRYDRWSQTLEVTFGELLPDGQPPLLKRRKELTPEQAIQLWKQKRQRGWQRCEPQWLPPPSPAVR